MEKEGHYITFKPRYSQQGEGSNDISVVWKIDDKTTEHFGNSVEIDEETNLKIDIDNWNTDKFNVSRTVKNKRINITDKFEICKREYWYLKPKLTVLWNYTVHNGNWKKGWL